MPNKRKSQFLHAAMRFSERTDIHFTREIHKEFVRKIRAGKNAVFVEHQSNRVSVWNVVHEAIEYRVVYDKIRGSIVTVLHAKPHDGTDPVEYGDPVPSPPSSIPHPSPF